MCAGLTETELEQLFVKCRRCKRIVIDDVDVHHSCAAIPRNLPIVIDLTADSSGADSDQSTVIDLTNDSDDD